MEDKVEVKYEGIVSFKMISGSIVLEKNRENLSVLIFKKETDIDVRIKVSTVKTGKEAVIQIMSLCGSGQILKNTNIIKFTDKKYTVEITLHDAPLPMLQNINKMFGNTDIISNIFAPPAQTYYPVQTPNYNATNPNPSHSVQTPNYGGTGIWPSAGGWGGGSGTGNSAGGGHGKGGGGGDEDELPICQYHPNCTRKNLDHFKQFLHPKKKTESKSSDTGPWPSAGGGGDICQFDPHCRDNRSTHQQQVYPKETGSGVTGGASASVEWSNRANNDDGGGLWNNNSGSSGKDNSTNIGTNGVSLRTNTSSTSNTIDDVGKGEAELVAELAESNLSYTLPDFRREFESIFERKATPAEVSLFLRMQRVSKARVQAELQAKTNKRKGTDVNEDEVVSDSLGGVCPREFQSYIFKKLIGSGAQGKVYMVEHKTTGVVRAVKIISLATTSQDLGKGSLDGEMKIGTEFGRRCLFLVDYEQVTVCRSDCFILMEYFAGGDLRGFLDTRMQKRQPFEEQELLHFLFEIGLAVQTLHAAGIVHRDIKPQNIFRAKNGSYKLGDYGTARFLSESNTMSMAGTSGYIAPEILQGSTDYRTDVDIYSLGCILFEMIELRHPFRNENGNLNFLNVSLGKHNASTNTHVSRLLVDLTVRMISVDVSKRPTIVEIMSFPLLYSFLSSFYTSVKSKELS